MYVTINDIEQDGVARPFEVFVNSKNLEHYAWVVALTRMISAVFRRGGEVAFVAEELKQVFDPRGGQWSNGRYVPLAGRRDRRRDRAAHDRDRVPAAGRNRWSARRPRRRTARQRATHGSGRSARTAASPAWCREAGCLSCVHCGWSKCG